MTNHQFYDTLYNEDSNDDIKFIIDKIKIIMPEITERIDWIQEFEKKFSGNGMISSLRKMKFHGKLEINFADGEPNTCHVNWCVKPYSSMSFMDAGR